MSQYIPNIAWDIPVLKILLVKTLRNNTQICFLLILSVCVCVCVLSHLVVSHPLGPHGQRSLVGYSPWDFPGKNTGEHCHFFVQAPNPEVESTSPILAGGFLTTSATWEAPNTIFSISQILHGISKCVSRSAVSDSLQPHGVQTSRLLCPWSFPGKNTGVGCHSHLQLHGIYLC